MSLNSKNLYDNDLTFTPFFRFIDDFNTYANQGSGENANANATFTPKFDIYEHKHSFTLHGELPGVEQKDIDIEFTDPEVSSFTTSPCMKSLYGY
jgi:HSP20 family protein